MLVLSVRQSWILVLSLQRYLKQFLHHAQQLALDGATHIRSQRHKFEVEAQA